MAPIPPHDLACESAILGAILIEGKAGAAIAKASARLTPDDFYTEAHRIIYRHILWLAHEEHGVDLITLSESLRAAGELEGVGGDHALAVIETHASVAVHLDDYIGIVLRHAGNREAIQLLTEQITHAFNGSSPVALATETSEGLARIAVRMRPTQRAFAALSVRELLAAEIPEPTFHVDGWIPTRGITFIVGDSEAYKSWLSTYVGFCIAAGRRLFDRLPVTQAPVLIVSEENGVVEDRRRVDLLCRGMGFDPATLPCYVASETAFSFDDPARYAALRAFLAERGIRLVIVDSFVRVHRREEKDAGAMNALYMDRMKPLIRDGVDLLLLHHRRKLPAGIHPGQAQQQTSESDDIRGSGDLRAAAHAVLFLKTLTLKTVVVRHNKARGFKKQDPFVFSLSDALTGGVVLGWEGKPADVLDKSGACREAILLYAKERPAFYRKDIVAALKGQFSKKVIDPVLKDMSDKGVPLRRDEHGRKTFYVYIAGEPDPPDPSDDVDVPF